MNENESTMTVALHTVEITRGLEKITRDVFAHEVPILRALHQEDAFRVTEEDVDSKEIDADVHAEYARLKRAFDQKNLQIVGVVYRDAQELGRAMGVRVGRAEESAPPKMSEERIGHRKNKPGKGTKPAAK